MSLNPDGAPAGYYYQAGATAYLIDPAGTYSPAGASAPTTDRPAQTAARARAPQRSPRRALIFRSPGRPPLRRRLSTLRALTVWRARARQRPTLPAQTVARARAPPRSPRRALLFRSQGRPPLRRRLSTLRALTVRRARARQRPIRPAGTAPLAPARRRSRPRARTFQSTGATSSAAEIVDPAALTVWRARARRRPIRPAGTAPPAPARRRSRPRALTFQ